MLEFLHEEIPAAHERPMVAVDLRTERRNLPGAILRGVPPRSPRRLAESSPRPSEAGPADPTDAVDSTPVTGRMADIKDQWRRYGLAEGMRQQADPKDVADSSMFQESEGPDDSRLMRRLLELERGVDIQAAMVKQLVSRIDRLERERVQQPGPDAHGPSASSLDRDPAGERGPARIAQTWARWRAGRRHSP